MVGGKTLNARKLFFALSAAVCLSGPAMANRVPGATLTGHVTATSNGDWIKIDGKSYRVKSGSPAAAAASKLTTGQYVDIQLNGPAGAAASEVVNVVPHSGS
jgi:hypothetical protein